MSHLQFSKLNRVLKDLGAVKIERWLITNDGVKRQYTGQGGKRHWQRLPKDLYRDLDEYAVKDLVSRLNAEDWRMKKALDNYEIQSAFIPPKILSEFEKLLYRESNPQTAKARFHNLKKYCLEFFLPKSPNPIAWQKDLQGEWLEYLVSLDYSDSTYKHIKTALNKFMSFLATKNPDLPYLQFKGLSRYQIAEIRHQREMKGLGVRRYIPEGEFSKIYDQADERLRPYIAIAYGYGLRRNELRALKLENIKSKHLSVEGQLMETGVLTLPKYRKTRKVPHWMMKPTDLYRNIEALQPYETGAKLSEAFSLLTKRLYSECEISAAYVLHDCRHSFVSNAVKSNSVHEVMIAAGHADLRTTSTYLKDTRSLDDEVFVPNRSVG